MTTLLALLFASTAFADGPVYTGPTTDRVPASAYNETNQEFLVVWEANGTVMGRRVNEAGRQVAAAFEIMRSGVEPDVAYNPATNQYLVVASKWDDAHSQHHVALQLVTAFGGCLFGQKVVIENARKPSIVHNSLAGNFLVTGARHEAGATPGTCNIVVLTRPVLGGGTPAVDPPYEAANVYLGTCTDRLNYAVAHAPLYSGKKPKGHFLLAVEDFQSTDHLKLLDEKGEPFETLYNPTLGRWYQRIPFASDKVGEATGIDVAFGYLSGEPVFLLVWGDTDQYVEHNNIDYGEWSGIWGGVVEADKLVYYTTDEPTNEVFPVSFQYQHWPYAWEWNPVAAYNHASARFVVAWRETPGTHPDDLTNENHIRLNTVDSTSIPPAPNLLASSTSGNEDPKEPCIVSSTQGPGCLIAWEDFRNPTRDIYASVLNSSTRKLQGIFGSRYWRAVVAGNNHSLGLYHQAAESGEGLWSWGYNGLGQLGLGDNDHRVAPVQVETGSDWAMVAGGWEHSLGIRFDGTLWSWGYNGWGQLGLGNYGNWPIPKQVGTDSEWVMVAGGLHSLGIRSDDTLWSWGDNRNGQLGLGDNDHRVAPVQVGTGSDWVMVAGGAYHSLGIRSDGTLWSWGYNEYGRLGLGDSDTRFIPEQVGTDSDWVVVAGDGHHSLGIRSDGTLWSWGYNGSGQLGLGDTTHRVIPVQVGTDSDWVVVAGGAYHSLGIRSDGTLWSWGSNWGGQLGLGDTTPHRVIPVQVGTDSDWVMVAGGEVHSLGIRSDGTLWSWGKNEWGQLGLGDCKNRSSPHPVKMSRPLVWLQLLLLQ